MKVLTTYNEQVRKYTAAPTAKAVTSKITRLAIFIANFTDVFEKAFTPSRKYILDEIIFKSSETGVYSASRETIAKNTNSSVRTVERVVSEIKKSGEFIVAQTANKRAGAYVFIDRRHENFETIVADLFDAEKLKAVLVANPVATLQNDETPTESKDEDVKNEKPTLLSLLSLKKSLEPKNLNNNEGSSLNKAIKVTKPVETRKTALYVRLSEVLSEKFDKKEMVDVMKHVEKKRKELSVELSDELLVETAELTAQSDNCRNFFGLWTYKIKAALGIVVKREAKKNLSAFNKKDDRSKLEKTQEHLAELLAKKAENAKTGDAPSWFYDDDIRRAELTIAKLTKVEDVAVAVENENTSQEDLESSRRELLRGLGYSEEQILASMAV